VVAILLGAYLVVGYVMYDRLSRLDGACLERNAANTPERFDNPGDGGWVDFDFTPYYMDGFEAVRFPSRQAELEIDGWYVEAGPDAPAVVITHGLNSCKRSYDVLTVGGMLWQAGFNVLLIDVRDSGESEIEDMRSSVGSEEHLDVLGAWDWLRREKGIPAERIGLLGHSMGAATTLIAFSQEPGVVAAWADSPFANLSQAIGEELARNNIPAFLKPGGLLMARVVAGDNLTTYDPEDAVRSVGDRHLFILHGTADERIAVHHSEQMAALAEQSGGDVTVWIVPGVGHVQTTWLRTEEYQERLIAFFGDALGAPGGR
jgi:dipeptidyl aminopeptidase/acylaminoacyl peptidase